MQLTGTNRSIGLIALIFSVHWTWRIGSSEWRMERIYSPFANHHSPSSASRSTACFVSLSFAGLVVLARSLNPIPSRTRPLNSSAPMVLWLKPWESRSLPGLPRTRISSLRITPSAKRRLFPRRRFCFGDDDVRSIGSPDAQAARVSGALRMRSTATCVPEHQPLEQFSGHSFQNSYAVWAIELALVRQSHSKVLQERLPCARLSAPP
jgi:hypothetical protein